MNWIEKYSGLILLVLGGIGLLWSRFTPSFEAKETPVETYGDLLLTTEEQTVEDEFGMVDIKGAILYPGLYEIGTDMRVGEVIYLAGGPTEDADLANINLAEKVTDGMLIIIPSQSVAIPNDLIQIFVEIKGEVRYPGVYQLSENARVKDLIQAAGGLTEDSDTSQLSQVALLADGDVIIVPKKTKPVTTTAYVEETHSFYVEIRGEVIHPGSYLINEGDDLMDLIYMAGGVTSRCDLSQIDWDIVLVMGASIYIPSYDDPLEEEQETDLVNINTADLETLMTLNGIGQILGQRIIDYRAENGDFLAIEDIMLVSGIKDSIYEQIKNDITV